jgi:hypothetical protein
MHKLSFKDKTSIAWWILSKYYLPIKIAVIFSSFKDFTDSNICGICLWLPNSQNTVC